MPVCTIQDKIRRSITASTFSSPIPAVSLTNEVHTEFGVAIVHPPALSIDHGGLSLSIHPLIQNSALTQPIFYCSPGELSSPATHCLFDTAPEDTVQSGTQWQV